MSKFFRNPAIYVILDYIRTEILYDEKKDNLIKTFLFRTKLNLNGTIYIFVCVN
jgi:hypothetical protein